MVERFNVYLQDGDTVKCEVVPSSNYDELQRFASHAGILDAQAETLDLREKLHAAECAAQSWKREAEMNEQDANKSAGYAARLAEAERRIEHALVVARAGFKAAPHQHHGKNLEGDFAAIVAALTTDSADVLVPITLPCDVCGADRNREQHKPDCTRSTVTESLK